MTRRRRFIITVVFVGLTLSWSLLVISPVAHASTFEEIIRGVAGTGRAAGYPLSNTAPKNDFVTGFATYVNGLLTIMGALFMVLMIYGGWLWMSARGNETQVERAKKLLLDAVIGIGLIIGGRLIVELALIILGQATNLKAQ